MYLTLHPYYFITIEWMKSSRFYAHSTQRDLLLEETLHDLIKWIFPSVELMTSWWENLATSSVSVECIFASTLFLSPPLQQPLSFARIPGPCHCPRILWSLGMPSTPFLLNGLFFSDYGQPVLNLPLHGSDIKYNWSKIKIQEELTIFRDNAQFSKTF